MPHEYVRNPLHVAKLIKNFQYPTHVVETSGGIVATLPDIEFLTFLRRITNFLLHIVAELKNYLLLCTVFAI